MFAEDYIIGNMELLLPNWWTISSTKAFLSNLLLVFSTLCKYNRRLEYQRRWICYWLFGKDVFSLILYFLFLEDCIWRVEDWSLIGNLFDWVVLSQRRCTVFIKWNKLELDLSWGQRSGEKLRNRMLYRSMGGVPQLSVAIIYICKEGKTLFIRTENDRNTRS